LIDQAARPGCAYEHHDDPYVQQAIREGYRSRACYKLLELQERDRLFRPGMTVLDLGSAPGGWSQVARSWSASAGGDRLRYPAMDSIADVTFVQGDFTENEVFERILAKLAIEALMLCFLIWPPT
jgi:23S rRNA (uridine2552-2'-O)-methyltransferase